VQVEKSNSGIKISMEFEIESGKDFFVDL